MENALYQELCAIVGPDHVQAEHLEQTTSNTIGVPRRVVGVVCPKSAEEVQRIVRAAGARRVPLYPVSRGMNAGYGDKAPVADGMLLVDLRRMDAIREYDPVLGYVVIEPGVTQEKLHAYLAGRGSAHLCDTSGASVHSSPLGNTVEGGFGHTPLGNHRRLITDLEVVLGDGTLIGTGTFPGLGPDLAGLFVQSNFGIITAMRQHLMPVPEVFTSFVFSFTDDEQLLRAMDTLRLLRQDGTLPSLIHVANATRALVSTAEYPAGRQAAGPVTDAEAARLLSTPLLRVGHWTALGGLYGRGETVAASKRVLKRMLAPYCKVRFYGDGQVRFLQKLLAGPLGRLMPPVIGRQFRSFLELRGLLRGIPTEEPMRNIGWRVTDPDRVGLLWFAPVIPATMPKVREAMQTAVSVLAGEGFECPMTMTFVEPACLVGVISIHFDRNDEGDRLRALRVYERLHDEFGRRGMQPYRTSIIGVRHITYPAGRAHALERLKEALDPQGIIAPGRYAIGASRTASEVTLRVP